MRIEHIAIWVKDLEGMRRFYERNFQASAGDKYENKSKKFTSYFLSFENGCRIELMHNPVIAESFEIELKAFGLIHFAIAVGSKEKVDALTHTLRAEGTRIIGEPRITGDGYYESLVLDPEGNQIEITI